MTPTTSHAPAQRIVSSAESPLRSSLRRRAALAKTRTVSPTVSHSTVTLVAPGVLTAPRESTGVRYVVPKAAYIPPRTAHLSNLFPIVTPLLPDKWEAALKAANLYHLFSDVPVGLREGFHMGIHSTVSETYTPPNHTSATAHPAVIQDYINKERAGGRYTGPFSRSRLEYLIGPFRTSPLGSVPKAGSLDERRIVQDFSFPRNDPSRSSINSEINVDDFPCEWGTFSEVVLLVMEAPPGTEAATLDVDAAFRRCPIHPSQQPNFVVQWANSFYLDHVCPFGSASSGGVFGRLADAISAIYIANDFGPLKKWVDDFLFFRYRISSNPPTFSYDLDDIYALAEALGWPWKLSKTRPFATNFKYIGFLWDLVHKTIQLPDDKKLCYIEKLSSWIVGATFTCNEAETILGTLVHCSLAVPDGRSRLPAISKFTSSFPYNSSPFSRRTPNATLIEDIAWWRAELSRPFCGSRIVKPPSLSPIEFWVDASTSWGIGIVFNGAWQRWRLRPGWHVDERGIGWAEMVAIEFGLRFAVHQGYSDVHFQIRSDNEGVIGALAGGKSRNPEQNRVLRRIVALMRAHSIWITTFYVPSLLNIADKPSRGKAAPGLPRATTSFKLPYCLKPFIHSSH